MLLLLQIFVALIRSWIVMLLGDLGSGLSGGQKQRLLLARALNEKPNLLALDEATRHLDIDNERYSGAARRHGGGRAGR